MKNDRIRAALARRLQAAYSSEMAAALAYQGHARSPVSAFERESIRQIERDEWRHREHVLSMLCELGAAPAVWRERLFSAIGRTVRALCPWSGWHAPMFVAGAIEIVNVRQYVDMAALASSAGLASMAFTLRDLAAVERQHARFFFGALAARHRTMAAALSGTWRHPRASRE